MAETRVIDYWGIVLRSARIAWNHKFLWFFGFFAASGGGGGGNYSSVGEHGAQRIRDFFLSNMEILVVLIMGIVVLWLVLLIMNVISKGALISCIRRADRGDGIRFEDGWKAGLRYFWGVLGIGLLGLFAFLVVSAVCVLAVILPIAGGAPGIAVAILIGAVLFLPFILFMFLLAFTIIFAEREYVIAGVTVPEALSTGWEMTRSHFWQTILMWLVAFASAMGFFIALMVLLLAMAIPFILIGVASPPAGLILGIPVGLVVLMASVAAYSTYDHSLWTLFYADLKGPVAGAPEVADPASPPLSEPRDPDPGEAPETAAGEATESASEDPPPHDDPPGGWDTTEDDGDR